MTNQELLKRSLAELDEQMRRHYEVVRMVAEGGATESTCLWTACSHQQLLRNLLLETVQVLEDTRKAFKSKQLEQLRKRLLKALSEESKPRAVRSERTIS